MKDGVMQTLQWTKQIQIPHREWFDAQARSLYMFVDALDGQQKVGGYFRQADNLTVIVTPKAGHMVPASQVTLSQNYIKDLLTYGKLQCGGKDCTTFATQMCSYMNQCSSHGTCGETTGQCTCDDGWLGADCSTEVLEASTTTIAVVGTKWTYF